MSNQKNSYKEIFKATSIFGGVQVFSILIAIIRSKAIAILLGTVGMGMIGLFTSTIELITSFTNFGLSTSAVKNIAAAHATNDDEKLGKTVTAFRILVWGTGLLGFLVTLILAPFLSKITFGNSGYTTAFLLLSVTLLITQLSAGQAVVLRGLRKISYMARATLFGSFFGLIVSLPLYYFFRENGIVPAIIATAAIALLFTWYFSRKVKLPKAKFDKSLLATEGREMLKMGFLISLSGLIALGASFVVRIFISQQGGVDEVGLYIAGFALVNTYVGMVFTAMATDYYPRLASVATDNEQCRNEINKQAEIALLILAPIIIIFLVFVNWAVVLLYSESFLPVVSMVHWAILGIIFKALSWAIAFIFLAKSDSRVFFWNELSAHIYILVLNLAGYYFYGLTGLGISFLLAYFLYFIQVFIISRKLYMYRLGKEIIQIFSVQFILAVLCLLIVLFLSKNVAYALGSILIIASCLFSWKELNTRIDINRVLLARLKR